MKSHKTTAKRIVLGLLVAGFAAPAAQAVDRPDDRAEPLGAAPAVSAVPDAFERAVQRAQETPVRPDDRAGPLGIGQEDGTQSQSSAALRRDDRPAIRGVGATPQATANPVDRIIAQERARSRDPRLFGVPATAPVQIVEPGGFDWGDAGIGAAAAVALMLLGLGTTLVVRHGRVGSA